MHTNRAVMDISNEAFLRMKLLVAVFLTAPKIVKISALALLLTCLYCGVRKFVNHIIYTRARKAMGCLPMKRYSHLDPLFGLDYIYAMLSALKQNRFLEYQKELYRSQHAKTFEAKFLGLRMIFSSESENMKAMSTSQQKNFGVAPIRSENGALQPFGGDGVSSTDGHIWQFSRDLIKPYFSRSDYSNLRRLDVHVDRLLEKIPRDGSTFDIQPLFQRWFFDTSTNFLFGESVNSLEYPERASVINDMITVMEGLRIRLQMTKFVFLHRDEKWFAAVKRVHVFLDRYIDQVFEDLRKFKKGGSIDEQRSDFLWTIAPHVPEKEALRSQLLGVFFPSNETTSILISNVIFALGRHPRVMEKLRAEIMSYGDAKLTWEQLRSMTYLRYVINETHRVYPISVQSIRACLKDCTLPVGGGPDGSSPIFVQKGDVVHCNRYLMHRDTDNWGKDAEDFIPERWEDARPMWKFVPFGGGPRICPAHTMVDTECSYVIARILQTFKAIESRDDSPYIAVMRAGPSNKNGVQVGLVPA
ncbi:hypothetical protein VTL71DRAFT_12399 [Oculimacula yallundae]|uniref:Cytochrome P450 n=1 Tax=Oculimacula yallundae TaxID=86028 RepID=A0ABR4CQ42_9HELO